MVDFIKLDYHLEDLDRSLTMMSSLLNSMIEERETEVIEIDETIQSIAEGLKEADTIELATFENRLIEIKYELIGIEKLSQKIKKRHNNSRTGENNEPDNIQRYGIRKQEKNNKARRIS